MNIYGGFVSAEKPPFKYTKPIAFIANSNGDALWKAKEFSYLTFPIIEGFVAHGYDVVELTGVIVTKIESEEE